MITTGNAVFRRFREKGSFIMRASCSKKRSIYDLLALTVLVGIFWCFMGMTALASDDNSLYDLGITTDGAEVDPDFSYDVWEYDVTVPAGTQRLELDPVPSSGTAQISEISGNEIAEDGTATVYITVTSESGQPFTYTLHVTSEEAPAVVETEPPTEKQTERATEKPKETEPETEDTAYVKVPKDTVDQAERTIKDLQEEITTYRNTTNLYTKIIYGMIAACVVLLFLVVNLALRGRDLKREVKEYRSLGYTSSKKSGKKAKGSSAKKAPAGPAQQPAAGSDPMYQSRQPAYYEKAPIDVAPQTSSRGKRTTEYEQPNTAGAQPPYPQGMFQGQSGQAYPQGQTGQAYPQGQSGQAYPQGQVGQAYPQGVSPVTGNTPAAEGSQERKPQEKPGQDAPSAPAADGERRGKTDSSSGGQSAAGPSGGKKRKRKDVEINMIDL